MQPFRNNCRDRDMGSRPARHIEATEQSYIPPGTQAQRDIAVRQQEQDRRRAAAARRAQAQTARAAARGAIGAGFQQAPGRQHHRAPAAGAAPRAAPAIPAAPRRGDPRYDPNRDPEYLGRLLQGYNKNVWRTNRQLQAAGERQEITLRQLRARAAATHDLHQAEIKALEGKLEIEESQAFDERVAKNVAIDFSCHLMKAFYYGGWDAARTPFTESGGPQGEDYQGHCLAIMDDDDALIAAMEEGEGGEADMGGAADMQ